jgi:hypothetical protein
MRGFAPTFAIRRSESPSGSRSDRWWPPLILSSITRKLSRRQGAASIKYVFRPVWFGCQRSGG